MTAALNRADGVKSFDNAAADIGFNSVTNGVLGWAGGKAGAMAVAKGMSGETGEILGSVSTFSNSNQINTWSNIGNSIKGQKSPCGCK